MSTLGKSIGTVIALALIFVVGPETAELTAIPGIAMLAFIWGFKL